MAKSHAHGSKRRRDRGIEHFDRNEEAGELIGRIMADSEPWTDEKQDKLEKELETMGAFQEDGEAYELDMQTLTICEDCLRIIGAQGNHRWSPMLCDICGEREYCGIFGPNDTLQPGDVYDNDREWLPGELRCLTCGLEEDPNIHSPGDVCKVPFCPGTLQIIDFEGDTEDSGMLVCNACATSWQPNWGPYCGKCHVGRKKVQYISRNQRSKPDHVGKTVKECGDCGVEWREGSTSCIECDGREVTYRVISVPDVPSRQGYQTSGREEDEVYRRYVPNHETGQLELISGPPNDDMLDGDLYSIREAD